MFEWGSEKAIISEINENDPIPYISNILGDTCPPNYNHTIKIYGQNFTPNSIVNIPSASNIATTIISPTEIECQFTSGAIIGAFDIEVLNDGKSSLLWGQSNKLNIINPTGGNLPLLDAWIDCRIGGSPDGMIGNIAKDNNSTWSRGIFGYSLTNMNALNTNWLNHFFLQDYLFGISLPLKLELIVYTSLLNGNLRWGLHLESSQGINASTGINLLPSSSYAYITCGFPNAPLYYHYLKYKAPGFPLNQYIKYVFATDYIGLFHCDISNFESTSKINDFILLPSIKNELLDNFHANGYTSFIPGLKFYGTPNSSNYSHLTAFKLSWA